MKHGLDIQLLEKIQEYLAMSIVNGIWQGLAIIFLLLFLEKILLDHSKDILHSLYKLFLLGIVFLNLFGQYLFRIVNSTISKISYPFHNHFDWIQWINVLWIVGVFVLATRLMISRFILNRIILEANSIFPDEWQNIFQSSKQKIGKQFILICIHSEKITTAFVTGFLKPIIIFPTCWINQLSKEEVEFIMIHELSHIKNKDHYINLICSISEILFFYNPAVHFIIKRIKLQREICADNEVLNHISNPLKYAQLLVKIGENNQLKPSIAFGSIKNQLSIRVKEILKLKTKRSTSIWNIGLVIFCFTLSLLLSYQNTKVSNPISSIETCTQEISMKCNSTVPKSNQLRKINTSSVTAKQENLKPNDQIEMKEELAKEKTISDVNEEKISFEHKTYVPNELELKFLRNNKLFISNDFADNYSVNLDVIPEPSNKTYIYKSLNPSSNSLSSSVVKLTKENSFSFDKELRGQYNPDSRKMRFFIVKNARTNILSYSINMQLFNQISINN